MRRWTFRTKASVTDLGTEASGFVIIGPFDSALRSRRKADIHQCRYDARRVVYLGLGGRHCCCGGLFSKRV
jgi:hypothetical protein